MRAERRRPCPDTAQGTARISRCAELIGATALGCARAHTPCNGVAPPRSNVAPPRSNVAPSRSNVAPSRSNVAPSRSSVAPSRSSVAPSRSSVAPSRNSVAPSRSNVAPSRSSVAPSRSSVAPSRSSVHTAATRLHELRADAMASCCKHYTSACYWAGNWRKSSRRPSMQLVFRASLRQSLDHASMACRIFSVSTAVCRIDSTPSSRSSSWPDSSAGDCMVTIWSAMSWNEFSIRSSCPLATPR
jgi:hypothetical protein